MFVKKRGDGGQVGRFFCKRAMTLVGSGNGSRHDGCRQVLLSV